MKTLKHILQEADNNCPPATQDTKLNTANKKAAAKDHAYGTAPICGNCKHFNTSIKKCLGNAEGIGYCEALQFKCSAAKWCNIWAGKRK